MRFSAYLSVIATSMCLVTASDTLGHTTNNSVPVALAETFSAANIHVHSNPIGKDDKSKPSTATTVANQLAT